MFTYRKCCPTFYTMCYSSHSKTHFNSPLYYWWARRDLNPHGTKYHWILSPGCLPFHHSSIFNCYIATIVEITCNGGVFGKYFRLFYYFLNISWWVESDSNGLLRGFNPTLVPIKLSTLVTLTGLEPAFQD